MRFSLEDIPAGEAGTDLTVKRLVQLVQMSETRPDIRLVALQIVNSANIPGRDKLAIAGAIHRFVKGRIRYVNDPIGIETVQQPEITLKLGAGDCDDQAALVAALARAVGIPARFAVIGQTPEQFKHIFTELQINGSWLPADTTSPRPFGTPAPNLGVKKVYTLKNNGGLSMPEVYAVPIPRDAAAAAARNSVWASLTDGWQTGQINATDIRNYIASINAGTVEFSGNTFFEPVIKQAAEDFLGYVESNGIPSRKEFTTGLQGLSGFFGKLWNGVTSVVGKIVKPAAVIGATILGGPAVGAAAAGALYSGGGGGGGSQPAQVPGYSGQPVTIPVGSGSVTYNQNLPYQPPAPQTSSDLFSSPLFLLGAAAVIILLMKK